MDYQSHFLLFLYYQKFLNTLKIYANFADMVNQWKGTITFDKAYQTYRKKGDHRPIENELYIMSWERTWRIWNLGKVAGILIDIKHHLGSSNKNYSNEKYKKTLHE